MYDTYQDILTCKYISLFEFMFHKMNLATDSVCETSEQSFSECYSTKVSKQRYTIIQTKFSQKEEFIEIMTKLFPSFLNGQKVILQKKYYEPFFYEISQYLLYSENYGKSSLDSLFICILAISMMFENNILRRYMKQYKKEQRSSRASMSQTENEHSISRPMTIPIIMNEDFLQIMEEQMSINASCFGDYQENNDLNFEYNWELEEENSNDSVLTELEISRELEDLYIELAFKKLDNDVKSEMTEERKEINEIPLVKAIQPHYYLLPNFVQQAPMRRILPAQPIRINSNPFVNYVKPFPAYLNHTFFRKNVKGIREHVLEPNYSFGSISNFSKPIYPTGPVFRKKN